VCAGAYPELQGMHTVSRQLSAGGGCGDGKHARADRTVPAVRRGHALDPERMARG
jgi:hypothetical protein